MTEQSYNLLQKLPYIHLIYSTPDLPHPSDQAIARQIQSVETLQTPEVNITWEMMALARVLGRIQFDTHEIRIAGLGQPLSPEIIDRTILSSQWQPQIKVAMRQHQSHLSLVYAGQSHDPIEKMIALYKVARAFNHENLLGIVNENAWTAHPVADTLSPEQITSYRENLPFVLWMGYIKIYTDPEHFWWVTKGHHLFDVPDLAYFVHPGEDENAILTTFINIFYYIFEQDVFVTAGDTLAIQQTGQTMRFTEVTEFEDFLMGPSGTLVIEKIDPDQVSP